MQRHLTPRSGRSNHNGSGHNPVRNHLITTRIQLLDTFNRNRIGPRANDLRTHLHSKNAARSWISGSLAALVIVVVPSAKHGGHHNILRCTDTWKIQMNITASKPFCTAENPAALFFNLRPERLKALQMKIDFAFSDCTASWLINRHFAKSG